MTNVHYPNPFGPDNGDFMPNTVIARDHIALGDLTITGKYIEAGGITIHPGTTDSEISRVTVTFLVGDIDIAPDAIDQVTIEQPLGFAIDVALAEVSSDE